jgi:hypothetical protein
MSKEVWNRVLVGDDTGLMKEIAFSPRDLDQAPRLLNTWGSQSQDCAITRTLRVNDFLVIYLKGSSIIELLSILDGSVTGSITVSGDLGHVVTFRVAGESLVYLTTKGYLIEVDGWTTGHTRESKRERLPTEQIDCAAWSEEDAGWFMSHRGSTNPVLVKQGKIEWTGKNQPDTKLGVTAKFVITTLLPLGPYLFAGDTEGQLRCYSHRLQRKAAFEIKNVFINSSNHNHASDAVARTRPITCMQALSDGNTVLCADTMGTLVAVDVNTKLVKHGYRGVMGSIRDIRLSDSDLYCVSAGRHLYRLNASKHRRAPVKIFLKQKLTSVCVLSGVEVEVERPVKRQRKVEEKDAEDEDADEDEDDEEEEAEDDDEDVSDYSDD